MKHFRAKHFGLSRFGFAFLGLALAVFAWGLQYKLSLYDPPQASSHKIPTAKLLSRDEQAITADSPLVSPRGDSSTGTFELVSLSVLSFLLWLLPPSRAVFPFFAGYREVARPFHITVGSRLNAFFFRPPPVLF